METHVFNIFIRI